MSAVLLSVRPRYANAILAGTKTAEVRRRFPDQPPRTTIYLYSSSPERAVVGTAVLEMVERPPAADVWRLYRELIEIERLALAEYLEGVSYAAVLRVTCAIRWQSSLPLSTLRDQTGLEPPQSFRYVSASQEAVFAEWAASPSKPTSDLV